MNKKIKLFLFLLFVTSSCSSLQKKNPIIEEAPKKNNVYFKIKPKKLFDLKEGVKPVILGIKWCNLNSEKCKGGFTSYHCSFDDDKSLCGDLEKEFKEAKIIKEYESFDYTKLFLKNGIWYIDSIQEISNNKFDKKISKIKNLNNDLYFNSQKFLTNPTLELKKDNQFARIVDLIGFGSIAFAENMKPSTPEEFMVAGIFLVNGVFFMSVGRSINYISTKDVGFINNFSTIQNKDTSKNIDNFLSFEVKENQVVNLGDIEMLIRIKGGKGAQRREGLVDLEFRNDLGKILKKDVDLKNIKIIYQEPKTGNLIGKFGGGFF